MSFKINKFRFENENEKPIDFDFKIEHKKKQNQETNHKNLNFVFHFIKKTNGTLGTRIVLKLSGENTVYRVFHKT